MASYANDSEGYPIEAGEVIPSDSGVFTCLECKESVHYRTAHLRDGYTVKACFVHTGSSQECTLYLGGKEIPPGYRPRPIIRERFIYDVNNKKIKIQSQTIDNADSKIFLKKKQDSFNLSMIINISITPESADYFSDGKIEIVSNEGTREVGIHDIKNSTESILEFSITSNFNKDKIQVENTPLFISRALQEDIIDLRSREVWILKDPRATGLLFEGSTISLNYKETYAILINKDVDISEFNNEFLQTEKFDDPNFVLFTFNIYSENQGKKSFDGQSDKVFLEELLGYKYLVTWNTTPKISLIDPTPIGIDKGTIYIEPGSKICKFKLENEKDIEEFHIDIISTGSENELTHGYKENGKVIEIDVSNAKAICITSNKKTNTYYKVIKKIPEPNTYLGISILIDGASYNLLDHNLKNYLKPGTNYTISESMANRNLENFSESFELSEHSYDGKLIDGGSFGNYQFIDREVGSFISQRHFSTSQKKILQWLRIAAGIMNQDTDFETIEKKIIRVYGKNSEYENHINFLKEPD